MSRGIMQIAAVGFKRFDGEGYENTLYALADDGSVWSMTPELAFRGSAAWKALPLLPQEAIPAAWVAGGKQT
jgi:hypothetical protein